MWSTYLEILSCCRFRSTGVPYLSERAHHQHGTPVSMSEEYEDDFENCYEEDFESEDGGLEVPALQEQPQQLYTEIDQVDAPPAAASAAASQLDKQSWPSLSSALQFPPSKGRRQAAGPALFGRSLFAVDPVSGPISSSSGSMAAANSDACITLQPPVPPLDDTQRRQAAAVLRGSNQLHQQVELHASTQLDLFVLQPLSLYQQYSQGVGVYAGRAAAACQTRQLDQDVREQDIQTEQIEQQPGSCQVPEDLYSSTKAQQQQAGASAQSRSTPPADLLAASDPAFAEFLDWAVPQVLFELQRAEAEAAAESTLVSAAAGPCFAAVQTAVHAADSSSNSSTTAGLQKLFAGELKLPCEGLLSGRPVVGIAGPPTPQAAAAAAAAVKAAIPASAAAAAAGGVSSHLLLACYGPVGDSAVSDHGLAGLGCLCVWDLLMLSSSKAHGHKPAVAAAAEVAEAAAGASSVPPGVLQLLVSEGRPTCCCWGAGEAATLVFAGMEEGSICCWDLAEPDKAHATAQPHRTQHQPQQQRQQQQIQGCTVPARRPSYSTEMPFLTGTAISNSFVDSLADSTKGSSSGNNGNSHTSVFTSLLSEGAFAAGGVTGLAAVPTVSGNSSYGSAAGAGGGAVCRLVALSAGGCVTLYSVMLGDAGSDVAVADLGMRSGSRVWLVKVCEGLPLGMEVVKPPHMKRSAAATAALTAKDAGTKAAPNSSSSRGHVQAPSGSCLLVLPGATQQLLVGTDGGRVLKGAALGVTQSPHEYTSVQWWPGLQCAAAPDTSAVLDAGTDGDAATAGHFAGSSDYSSSGIGSSTGSGSLSGAVTSLSVCPLLPDAWAAGHSCGRVAVFSQKRSRPCWVWQHPTGAPVVAVRWLPKSCVLLAAFGSSSSSSSSSSGSCLAAFNFATTAKHQPAAVVALHSAASQKSSGPSLQASKDGSEERQLPSTSHGQPAGVEVLSMSGNSTSLLTSCSSHNGSDSGQRDLQHSSSSRSRQNSGRRQQQGLRVCVAVGFSDGSCSVYELDAGWSNTGQSLEGELEALQALIGS